ncbi:hypothetical protein [Halobacillus kuroshimensis]|uniref:hypothetical protein n=1 Tax=Halobacillus kuroshimensis TaxID=302481 RepID=UPI00047FB435|nr:hypothetical protein [Halobacillus kuroshimensis]
MNAAGTPSADLVRKAACPSGSSARAVPAGITTERSSCRRWNIEERRRFADSKERLGLHYGRLRGKEKEKEQALITAACRNMKKIVLHPATMSWVKESLFHF